MTKETPTKVPAHELLGKFISENGIVTSVVMNPERTEKGSLLITPQLVVLYEEDIKKNK